MSDNTVYQLKENDSVMAEGTVVECWAELIKKCSNWTVAQLFTHNVRIEPKSCWHEKRPYIEIRADKGYYEGFWLWRNGPLPEKNNVVSIKEAAHG